MNDKCEFCGGTENLEQCGWKTADSVVARVRDLRVGDRIRLFNSDPGQELVTVTQIMLQEALPGQFRGHERFKLWLLGAGDEPFESLLFNPLQAVRIFANQKCGRTCCERHYVDRTLGHFYCCDHWKALENAGD